MNILITGANGQLGNEMRLVSQESNDTYLFTDVNQVEGVTTTYLDITDLDAVRRIVTGHRVGVIVNCAAWTNVDACETDESLAALAEKLNAEAPHNLAVVMKEVGGLLIHISTDYVFGQEPYNVPCREEQQGTPTGVYGATKKHGEDAPRGSIPSLARTSARPCSSSPPPSPSSRSSSTNVVPPPTLGIWPRPSPSSSPTTNVKLAHRSQLKAHR